MPDVELKMRWLGSGLRFESETPSGRVELDGDGAAAVTPVQALLVALTGCMAADVMDIGGTMRLPITGLEVEAEGDRAAEPPRRYTAIRLRFTVHGVAVADEAKVRRALALSRDKYCSVLHTLRPDLDVRTELRLEMVPEGNG